MFNNIVPYTFPGILQQGTKLNYLDLSLDYPLDRYKYDTGTKDSLVLINNLDGWSRNVNLSLDASITYEGEPTVKFLGDGVTPYDKKTLAAPIDVTLYDYIELIIHINEAGISKPSATQRFYLYNDGTDNHYFEFYNHFINEPRGDATAGWRHIRIPLTKAIKANNGDLTNVKAVQFLFGATPSSYLSFNVAQVNLCKVAKGQLCIDFDDSHDTDHNVAFPILSARGLVASSYIITDNIGTQSRLTEAQLIELHEAGWMIGSHTSDHLYFTTNSSTASEIEATIKKAQLYIRSKPFWRGAYFMSTPGGEWNQTARAVCEKYNIMTRIGDTDVYTPIYPDDNHTVGYGSVSATNTLASIQAIIDNVVTHKMIYHLTFHRLQSPASAQTITPEFFEDIMDYVKTKVDAGVLDVVTPLDQYL